MPELLSPLPNPNHSTVLPYDTLENQNETGRVSANGGRRGDCFDGGGDVASIHCPWRLHGGGIGRRIGRPGSRFPCPHARKRGERVILSPATASLCGLLILLIPLTLAGLTLMNSGLGRSRTAAHAFRPSVEALEDRGCGRAFRQSTAENEASVDATP